MNWNTKSPKLLLTIVLCAMLLASPGCNRQQIDPAALFPTSGEAQGWSKEGNTRLFEAGDLWKYIDGGAERYLRVGVERVVTADYKFQNKIDAVVDIYTMADTTAARKMFESEPMGDAKSAQVGDNARLYAQSLVFCRGAYLVRIVAYEDLAEAQATLVDLGRSIDQRLARR